MHKYICVSIASIWMACSLSPCTAGTLTLENAIQRTLDQSPGIRASQINVDIREAELIQAGLSPNPEFDAEYDGGDSGGKGSKCCDEPEFSYGLSQTFELGGKRQARVDFAESVQEISSWDAALKEQEVCRSVAEAFMAAAKAQEKIRLAQEHRNVAEDLRHAISCKVDAGKESPLQEKKARLTLSSRDIAYKRALSDYSRTQQHLIALWACEEVDFEGIEYPFYELMPPRSWDSISLELECHPSVARWDSEITAATRAVELEEAQRVPDLTLAGGVTHEGGRIDQTSFYVGLSIPIPVCNRNQGHILRAYRQVEFAEQKKQEALCTLKADMRTLYLETESAYEQAREFKEHVLEMAQQTFQTMKEGFQQGQVDCIEVFEAQKILFEFQEEYVNLLYEYHTKNEMLYYYMRRPL